MLKNWIIATIVVIFTIIVINMIGILLSSDVSFMSGWIGCLAYFVTLKYLEDRERNRVVKIVTDKLTDDLEYYKNRCNELNSQLITERSMRTYKN